MAFEYVDSIFYLVVWAIGFLAATVRVIRDHSYINVSDLLSIGMSGGFFAFGFVCILLRFDPPDDGNGFFYLGISALVGLLGKEQDKYLRLILKKVFKTIGVDDISNE